MTASGENVGQGMNWTTWLDTSDASQKMRDQHALADIARELEAEQARGYEFVQREKVEHLLTAMGRLAGYRYETVASSGTAITLLLEGLEKFESLDKDNEDLNSNADALERDNKELKEEFEKLRTPVEGFLLSEEERVRVLTAVQKAVEVVSLVPGHSELTKQLSIGAFVLEGLTPSIYREVKEGQTTD